MIRDDDKAVTLQEVSMKMTEYFGKLVQDEQPVAAVRKDNATPAEKRDASGQKTANTMPEYAHSSDKGGETRKRYSGIKGFFRK